MDNFFFIRISEDQTDNPAYQASQDWKVTVVWMEIPDWMEHQVYQVIKVFQASQDLQELVDYQVFR
jgi:hypothetical protein